MAYVSVHGDIHKALYKLAMTKAEARKAIVRALNRTADSTKVEAARQIKASGFGVKVATIKKSLSVRKAVGDILQAEVHSRGRPIPLIEFNARQTKKGVTANVKRGRKLWPGAFIATMSTGHTGVFTHKPGMQTGKRGKPIHNRTIREEFGPGVPSQFGNTKIMAGLKEFARDEFIKRAAHEFKRLQGIA